MQNRMWTAQKMTTQARPRERWLRAVRWMALGVALLAGGGVGGAQEAPGATPAPVALTLKRTVEMALVNSRDIRAAKMQANLAQQSANVARAEFLPNLYAGSGAAYTNGIPETPGGRAPAPFSAWYTQQVFNQPLRGQWREAEQQAKSQALALEEVRNLVIERTAGTYLELVKLRHDLELLKQQGASAQKIMDVTQERAGEGLELPIETTRAQLTLARIKQRILQSEGRQEELEAYLRNQTGLQPEQPIDVSPEELPAEAEQAGQDLVAMALTNNPGLQQAEMDRQAKAHRLKGEKGGYWPTVQAVGIYSLLTRFNNYDQFFKTFQRNNVNIGVEVDIPIFSARTRAAIALAQSNFNAAQANVAQKRTELTAEVRRKTHRLREFDAAKEVARLELQLAQQNLGVLQAQFEEDRVNLREVERARLDESEKWMGYLDANLARQQAQLELLRTTGQLEKIFQ
jgi:outer membrane protein